MEFPGRLIPVRAYIESPIFVKQLEGPSVHFSEPDTCVTAGFSLACGVKRHDLSLSRQKQKPLGMSVLPRLNPPRVVDVAVTEDGILS